MTDVSPALSETGAPSERDYETLDVRELPPPGPLTETLERLAALDESLVLVQLNDRAPQHLYPQLDERGYDHETVPADDVVLTAIWREETQA